MMTLRLTKQFSFEMAHALPAYEGKCRNIHGHSYKLFVTVEGSPSPAGQEGLPLPGQGMVIDFHGLKECVEKAIVEPFDHALVLPRIDGMYPEVLPGQPTVEPLGGYSAKLIMVDFLPTTENLLIHFAHLLRGGFPPGVRLYSLRLYETETSCAELIL